MAIAAAAAGAVSVIGGVTQSISSAKKARDTRLAIKNYDRQELKNVYDDLTVSTMGADLQREELARSNASSVQALRAGGVRSVIGGVGKVQQQNSLAARAIGADLDRQMKEIEQLRASDEANIRQMQETREQEDLRGLGQQLNVQNQATMSGINNAISGLGSIATAGLGGAFSGGAGAAGSAATAGMGGSHYAKSTLDSAFKVRNPVFNPSLQLPY